MIGQQDHSVPIYKCYTYAFPEILDIGANSRVSIIDHPRLLLMANPTADSL